MTDRPNHPDAEPPSTRNLLILAMLALAIIATLCAAAMTVAG